MGLARLGERNRFGQLDLHLSSSVELALKRGNGQDQPSAVSPVVDQMVDDKSLIRDLNVLAIDSMNQQRV